MPGDQGRPIGPIAGDRQANASAIALPELAFFVVALAVVVAISALHLFHPINIVSYDRDVWHHIAVLNALLDSPFHAGNPHIVSDVPSRSYMPWYVALAVLGRWLGLTAQQLLGISATLSMLALVVGIRLFSRAYFGQRWAPLVLLLVTFGSWAGAFNHTGFHTFSTMAFSASYPFAIVFGAGYIAWWLVLEALRSKAPRQVLGAILGAIALITAFMFATHQLQAAFAIGGMLTFALFHGSFPYARRGLIVLAVLAGVLLSSRWWYYNPLDYAAIGGFYSLPFTPPFDWTNPLVVVAILGHALVGVVGFYDLRRKAWRLDLALGTAGIIGGLIVLYLAGSWMVLRLLPFLVVFLQISTTALLFDLPDRSQGRFRGALRPILVGVIVGMFVANAAMATGFSLVAYRYLDGQADAKFETWSRDINATASAVRAIVGDGRVVIANWTTAYPMQAHHMKVVSIPYHFPEVPDSPVRQEASRAFFAPETGAAQRCSILRQYNVAAIVYRGAMVPAQVQLELDAFGEKVDVNDVTVVRLPAPGACAQP